jgi:hypothetical protein
VTTLLADVTDTATGITVIYRQTSETHYSIWNSTIINVGIPYFSISVALNVILTLMIVTRLVLLSRNVRNTMNSPVKISGLYRAVVTMLVESCALYAVSFLLFIGAWAGSSPLQFVFYPILTQTQVSAISLTYPNLWKWFV